MIQYLPFEKPIEALESPGVAELSRAAQGATEEARIAGRSAPERPAGGTPYCAAQPVAAHAGGAPSAAPRGLKSWWAGLFTDFLPICG